MWSRRWVAVGSKTRQPFSSLSYFFLRVDAIHSTRPHNAPSCIDQDSPSIKPSSIRISPGIFPAAHTLRVRACATAAAAATTTKRCGTHWATGAHSTVVQHCSRHSTFLLQVIAWGESSFFGGVRGGQEGSDVDGTSKLDPMSWKIILQLGPACVCSSRLTANTAKSDDQTHEKLGHVAQLR